MAYIRIKKKMIYLGVYKSEKDAAIAYDRRAREEFKDFARTNF